MKILLVKTSALGDIVQSFGVVEYLRHRFPEAEIDWVVEEPFRGLVEAHPDVRRCLTVATKSWRQQWGRSWPAVREARRALRAERYDWVFDLQGNIKSGLITSMARAETKVGFGKGSVAEWPNRLFTHQKVDPPQEQNIREDYLALVQQTFEDMATFQPQGVVLQVSEAEGKLVESLGGEEVALICPGSAWPNKQADEQALAGLVREVGRTFEVVWIWGNGTEKAAVEQLCEQVGGRVAPKLSLAGLQNLMARCGCVVAMDSLPLHLCGTTETPSFSLFGPSLAHKYRPLGTHHEAIQGSCPYEITFEKRCARLRSCPTGACLKDLSSEMLSRRFRQWIQ